MVTLVLALIDVWILLKVKRKFAPESVVDGSREASLLRPVPPPALVEA